MHFLPATCAKAARYPRALPEFRLHFPKLHLLHGNRPPKLRPTYLRRGSVRQRPCDSRPPPLTAVGWCVWTSHTWVRSYAEKQTNNERPRKQNDTSLVLRGSCTYAISLLVRSTRCHNLCTLLGSLEDPTWRYYFVFRERRVFCFPSIPIYKYSIRL